MRKEEIYTVDDIYALPEGERAELIDGKIYYMAPPNTKHQAIVMVYRFEKGTMEQYSFGEDVPVGIYEGFTIKIE